MAVIQGLEWTFDTVAESYARLRPEYPAALYADIFRCIPLDASCRAVEVGIGGGQATRPVLDTGCTVTAVEYGKNLTALCRRKFAAYPNFSALNMRFEEYDGTPDSCDLIYSASAFHWIPEQLGYEKVFSMLKSGGVFARFANHPYEDKGRPALSEAIQRLYAVYMPGVIGPKEYSEENARKRAEIAAKYGFTDISYHLYHRTRTFSAKEYSELLGTNSDHIILDEEPKKRFFSEVEQTIARFGGAITLYDTVDLQLARKP